MRTKPTAASMATPQESTMSSDIRILGASRLALVLVSSEFNFATATQTHVIRPIAVTSQPMRTADCQMVNTDAITPPITPTDAAMETRTPEDVLRSRSEEDSCRLTVKS